MESNWVDFKAIKQAVPLPAVLRRYQVQGLKTHGQELRGRCPIHKGEGTESFHVNTQKNVFQCFSCKAKGNVLDFVAAMEQCSVRDAGLKLQDWFGLAAGAGAGKRSDQPAPPADTSTELARERIAGETGQANKPLGFELRGIDHGHAYLAGRAISKETAQHLGVGFFSGKGSMSGRVVIPIHNEAGELVAYAGRSIDASEPRYKLPAGFHKSLVVYNLHRAKAAGQGGLIVVEGFFDAMKVSQAGYPFVVALMGCTLSEEQERLLLANADMLLLLLDGDEAGRKATDELLLRLGRKVWTKVAMVPDGKQPDQLTAEELEQLLKN
jgi:DNA primase